MNSTWREGREDGETPDGPVASGRCLHNGRALLGREAPSFFSLSPRDYARQFRYSASR